MDKIVNILEEKIYNISGLLLKNYKKLNISEEELIVIIYLINLKGKIAYNPTIFIEEIDMEKYKIMNIISSLVDKKIISVFLEKNSLNKTEEYINLEMLYTKLASFVLDKVTPTIEDNSIFEMFEKEFGRTLSPMEYEIIKGWINDKFSDILIKEALKEAIYNGVNNLRYIDKILYEWNKKGIKNKDDIIKDKTKRRTEISKKVDIPDYNWLDE